jgi:transposase
MDMNRPFGSGAELERRRRRALELLNQGQRQIDIATFLGVNRYSIYRWRRQAALDPANVAAKPHPHWPAALTTEQVRTLEGLLLQGAVAHGWHNQLWTTDRVATLIERFFQIRYHHDHKEVFQRIIDAVTEGHREFDANAAYPTQFWGDGYIGFGRKSWPGGESRPLGLPVHS